MRPKWALECCISREFTDHTDQLSMPMLGSRAWADSALRQSICARAARLAFDRQSGRNPRCRARPTDLGCSQGPIGFSTGFRRDGAGAGGCVVARRRPAARSVPSDEPGRNNVPSHHRTNRNGTRQSMSTRSKEQEQRTAGTAVRGMSPVEEVAERNRVPRTRIFEEIRHGRLRAVKVGRLTKSLLRMRTAGVPGCRCASRARRTNPPPSRRRPN